MTVNKDITIGYRTIVRADHKIQIGDRFTARTILKVGNALEVESRDRGFPHWEVIAWNAIVVNEQDGEQANRESYGYGTQKDRKSATRLNGTENH
jgi:hypothetical protein